MPTPIPPLLTPYVAPAPQGSLTLVTSVLDATSNWLLLRYIYATLENHRVEKTHEKGDVLASSTDHEIQENFKVMFVSVLRGFEQWREMGKRMGLDFPGLISNKRLVYISGLTVDLMPPPSALHDANGVTFDLSNIQDLQDQVRRYAVQEKSGESVSRTILIMDGLDFLLASQPSITSLAMSRTIMTLRQHVHSMIVTSSADYPLLHNSSPSATPLESEHRAFVATMAHQARMVLQLRSLGTGAAKDISGTLRVSAGGAHDDSETENGRVEEGEWLYQVKGDGSVKVWGRGE